MQRKGPYCSSVPGFACIYESPVSWISCFTCEPAYDVLLFMTTLWIFPNLPKYSGRFRTCGDNGSHADSFQWRDIWGHHFQCVSYTLGFCFWEQCHIPTEQQPQDIWTVVCSLILLLDLLPGRRAAARAPPQTPGSSEPLGRWPGACGFLSPSASSRSAFASFRSLSFGCLPVTEVCTPPDPLGTAAQHKNQNAFTLLSPHIISFTVQRCVALNWRRRPRLSCPPICILITVLTNILGWGLWLRFTVIMYFSSFPHLSARGTEAVLVCADAMPTEAADLVAAGAGEEVDIVNLQRLHAQRALHGVVL